MYYIKYDKTSKSVVGTFLTMFQLLETSNYAVAEYKGEIPKNDWLTVDNLHEEIETWTEKETNEQGQEVEVEHSKTHIVCDLVPHFRQKIEPSKKQLAQKRIKELKNLLVETDYQAIKYAEGWLTAEGYEPIKIQRQAWRDEINELEKI